MLTKLREQDYNLNTTRGVAPAICRSGCRQHGDTSRRPERVSVSETVYVTASFFCATTLRELNSLKHKGHKVHEVKIRGSHAESPW
jgi:hypothetical protein